MKSSRPRAGKTPEGKPLSGIRVGVTRPRDDSAGLADVLASRGALPVRMPAVRITFHPSAAFDEVVLRAAHHPDRHVFVITSRNGSRALLNACARIDVSPSRLAASSIAVVGPGTGEPLVTSGVEPTLVARVHTARGLVDDIRGSNLIRTGQTVIFPRARDATETIRRGLGPAVQEFTVYAADPEVPRDFPDPDPDVVTFASASAARYFAHVYPREPVSRIRNIIPVVCIGPATAAVAQQQGYRLVHSAEVHTNRGLADAVTRIISSGG